MLNFEYLRFSEPVSSTTSVIPESKTHGVESTSQKTSFSQHLSAQTVLSSQAPVRKPALLSSQPDAGVALPDLRLAQRLSGFVKPAVLERSVPTQELSVVQPVTLLWGVTAEVNASSLPFLSFSALPKLRPGLETPLEIAHDFIESPVIQGSQATETAFASEAPVDSASLWPFPIPALPIIGPSEALDEAAVTPPLPVEGVPAVEPEISDKPVSEAPLTAPVVLAAMPVLPDVEMEGDFEVSAPGVVLESPAQSSAGSSANGEDAPGQQSEMPVPLEESSESETPVLPGFAPTVPVVPSEGGAEALSVAPLPVVLAPAEPESSDALPSLAPVVLPVVPSEEVAEAQSVAPLPAVLAPAEPEISDALPSLAPVVLPVGPVIPHLDMAVDVAQTPIDEMEVSIQHQTGLSAETAETRGQPVEMPASAPENTAAPETEVPVSPVIRPVLPSAEHASEEAVWPALPVMPSEEYGSEETRELPTRPLVSSEVKAPEASVLPAANPGVLPIIPTLPRHDASEEPQAQLPIPSRPGFSADTDSNHSPEQQQTALEDSRLGAPMMPDAAGVAAAVSGVLSEEPAELERPVEPSVPGPVVLELIHEPVLPIIPVVPRAEAVVESTEQTPPQVQNNTGFSAEAEADDSQADSKLLAVSQFAWGQIQIAAQQTLETGRAEQKQRRAQQATPLLSRSAWPHVELTPTAKPQLATLPPYAVLSAQAQRLQHQFQQPISAVPAPVSQPSAVSWPLTFSTLPSQPALIKNALTAEVVPQAQSLRLQTTVPVQSLRVTSPLPLQPLPLESALKISAPVGGGAAADTRDVLPANQNMPQMATLSASQVIQAVNQNIPVHVANFPAFVNQVIQTQGARLNVVQSIDVTLQPAHLGQVTAQFQLTKQNQVVVTLYTQSLATARTLESYVQEIQQIVGKTQFSLSAVTVKQAVPPARSASGFGQASTGQQQGDFSARQSGSRRGGQRRRREGDDLSIDGVSV